METSRATRIAAGLALVPILGMTAVITYGIDGLSNGHATVSALVLSPLLVLLAAVFNLVMVYTASTRRSAWTWSAPLLVVAGPCLIMLLQIGEDLLQHGSS